MNAKPTSLVSVSYERARDLSSQARVILQQCDVGLERCAAALLGHAREQERRQLATADLRAFSFRECLIQNPR